MTAILSPLRTGRITASRVPKILGLSPHGDADDVLREMVRDLFGAPSEFDGNRATDWGHEHEYDGIREYELERGVLVTGAQEFTIHPVYDWMGMSPDGQLSWVEDGDTEGPGLVEVKCPYRARYVSWDQRPDIAAQQQFQIACAGDDIGWNDLVVWRTEGTTISRNHRDDTWFDFVYPQLQSFHDRYLETVSDMERVAPFLQPLVDVRTDTEWLTTAAEYLECRMDKLAAEAAMNDAAERLRELAAGGKAKGGGVTVSAPGSRAGKVNMTALAAEFHFTTADVNRHRGDPTGTAATVRASKGKSRGDGDG